MSTMRVAQVTRPGGPFEIVERPVADPVIPPRRGNPVQRASRTPVPFLRMRSSSEDCGRGVIAGASTLASRPSVCAGTW